MNAVKRRGPLRAGERVQLTDSKGRHYTISLTEDGYFHSTRGSFRHSDLIGKDEGSVIDAGGGRSFLALRPLISDFVLSMPRGATVIYPKDAGHIVHMADVFPGARVFEAGLGSGALTISLLGAVGDGGEVVSAELRPEFAEIAQGNVYSWYGSEELPWRVEIGDGKDVLASCEASYFDHVILDMLAPWEMIDAAIHGLRPGGVILAYVATTTQMSRFVEALRDSECFTEPSSSETLLRTWHCEGLAVRPDHRMVAHTGFVVIARRMADDSPVLRTSRRPAKLAYSQAQPWEAEDFEERTISPKKLRKVRRDVAHRADVEESGTSKTGPNSARLRARMDEELMQRLDRSAPAESEEHQ